MTRNPRPAKAANAIIAAVEVDKPPAFLLLGNDALNTYRRLADRTGTSGRLTARRDVSLRWTSAGRPLSVSLYGSVQAPMSTRYRLATLSVVPLAGQLIAKALVLFLQFQHHGDAGQVQSLGE